MAASWMGGSYQARMPGPVRVTRGSGRPFAPSTGCSGGELGAPGSGWPPPISR